MSNQTQAQDNAQGNSQGNSQVRQTPIETHRDGRITAAIWANEGERGPMYNATLSYSYQDKEGTGAIHPPSPAMSLLKAGRLMEMAYASVHRLKEQDRAKYVQQQQGQAQQAQGRAQQPSR
ncbi:MAG: hypothetical protein H6844_19335 [Alphaproteobacteria bacterium]|nr:hypothetical protein [Alphaproteobacteria bacterium]